MNAKYQHMIACFEEWASDASSIISGEAELFKEYPMHIDKVSDALLKPSTNDVIVQEILVTIFLGFSALLERMVSDHLSGGGFDVELIEERKKETAFVEKNKHHK